MENDTFMNLNDIHLSRDSWPSYSKYDLKFTSSHRNFHKRNFHCKLLVYFFLSGVFKEYGRTFIAIILLKSWSEAEIKVFPE